MTTLHSCPHCNAPAKDGTPYQPYCCVGCKTAYALVSAAGLDGFYQLRGQDAAVSGERAGAASRAAVA
jgi:hypothetical protein